MVFLGIENVFNYGYEYWTPCCLGSCDSNWK